MTTNLNGSDSPLAVTGFGPGTILVAIIGGALTFGGWVMRKVARR
jgi:hypothetical protein